MTSRDLSAGPDGPPADEIASAEASLAVLQTTLHPIGTDDLSKQTPCGEYDIAALTDHLMSSITGLGGAAGASFGDSTADGTTASAVDSRIVPAARTALDAWHHRGLDGSVSLGPGEMPARLVAGILSIEFLVHAWDYATAMGRDIDAPEPLAGYVLDLAQTIITPQGRVSAGFRDPVELPSDATAFEQLLAYTGRKPVGYPRP